jgi:hypothetical protein
VRAGGSGSAPYIVGLLAPGPRLQGPGAAGHNAKDPAAVGHGVRCLTLPARTADRWRVPHGGRNSECRGPRRQMYICRKF